MRGGDVEAAAVVEAAAALKDATAVEDTNAVQAATDVKADYVAAGALSEDAQRPAEASLLIPKSLRSGKEFRKGFLQIFL